MPQDIVQTYRQAVLLVRDTFFLDCHDLVSADTIALQPYRNASVVRNNPGGIVGFLHRFPGSTVNALYPISIVYIISGNFADRIQCQFSSALKYDLLRIQHLDSPGINGCLGLYLHISLININIRCDYFILSRLFFHIVHDLVIQDLLIAAVLRTLYSRQGDLIALDGAIHDVDAILSVFLQIISGRIADADLIHGVKDLSGILCPDVALPGHAVDNIFSHEAKRPDSLTVLRPDHCLFSGIQIPDIQLVAVVDVIPFLPYDDLMVLRYLKAVILSYTYQLFSAAILQIHIIDTVFQEKIYMLLSVPVQQLFHLILQHRIALGIWDIDFFLDRIQRIVIADDLNAGLSLMSSAIHVTIHGKFHITALVYIQNLDAMIVIQSPPVGIIFIIEGEDHCQSVGSRIIAE